MTAHLYVAIAAKVIGIATNADKHPSTMNRFVYGVLRIVATLSNVQIVLLSRETQNEDVHFCLFCSRITAGSPSVNSRAKPLPAR